MPRTREQYEEIKKRRKEEILLTALKLFCKKGYEATSVDDIAAEVGCSHGLFYHYYKGKQEIFDNIIQKTRGDAVTTLKSLSENDTLSAPQKLERATEYYYNKIINDETFAYYFYFKISNIFINANFNYDQNAMPKERPCVSYIYDIMEKGQLNGELNDGFSAVEYTRLYWSIIQGTTLNFVIAPHAFRHKLQAPNIKLITDIFIKKQEA